MGAWACWWARDPRRDRRRWGGGARPARRSPPSSVRPGGLADAGKAVGHVLRIGTGQGRSTPSDVISFPPKLQQPCPRAKCMAAPSRHSTPSRCGQRCRGCRRGFWEGGGCEGWEPGPQGPPSAPPRLAVFSTAGTSALCGCTPCPFPFANPAHTHAHAFAPPDAGELRQSGGSGCKGQGRSLPAGVRRGLGGQARLLLRIGHQSPQPGGCDEQETGITTRMHRRFGVPGPARGCAAVCALIGAGSGVPPLHSLMQRCAPNQSPRFAVFRGEQESTARHRKLPTKRHRRATHACSCRQSPAGGVHSRQHGRPTRAPSRQDAPTCLTADLSVLPG